jgi:hypothetical protein
MDRNGGLAELAPPFVRFELKTIRAAQGYNPGSVGKESADKSAAEKTRGPCENSSFSRKGKEIGAGQIVSGGWHIFLDFFVV